MISPHGSKMFIPWFNNIAHFQETYVRFDMDFQQVCGGSNYTQTKQRMPP